jgi:tetratricopeptide (TPR) repeat protein
MTQRADEVGGAVVLKAVHSPIGGPADGLPRMVARHLRLVGLDRAQTLERAETLMRAQGLTDPHEWQALTELVSPAPETDGSAPHAGVRFRTAAERHMVVRRLIERLTAERPVVVRLEDVQWGADALEFALRFVRAQEESPSPVLLVLTARDEALADRPAEAKRIEEVLATKGASRHHVPALSPGDHRTLIEALLGLEGDLAEKVADRTGGNPLFAVQLVGDWVQRGVLEVGENGFVLQAGERAVLPDDIHQVWSLRLSRALLGQPESAQVATELAAILGGEVDQSEWQAVAEEAGVELPPGLLDALVMNRLAIRVPGGFELGHQMLGESLERSARENQRFESLHRMAASMLRRRHGIRAKGVPGRLARHYLAAGALELALQPLLMAAKERFDTGEFQEALGILAERDAAIRELKTAPEDPRWGDGWALEAHLLVMTGDLAGALKKSEETEAAARRYGWPNILAEALWVRAAITYRHGDSDQAIARYQDARSEFERVNDAGGVARSVFGVGDAYYRLGKHREAEQRYQEALALFEAREDMSGTADCLWGLGYVAMWRNDFDRATQLFARQLELAEQAGNRHGMATALNAQSEVKRLIGAFEEAEAGYRKAVAIDQAIGSIDLAAHESNLGLVLLARGQYDEARELTESIRARFVKTNSRAQVLIVDSMMLAPAIMKGETELWDAYMTEMIALIEETGSNDGDLALALEIAGRCAAERNDVARARRAYEICLAQWQGLRRPDKSRAVEVALSKLG